MFNLDQAITEWRRQMLRAGIKAPAPLDELESHLREEVEQQIKSGCNEQKAFEISAQRIGEPDVLKREFKKDERTFMKRIMIIVGGIFGVLIGTGLILPALAQYKKMSGWTGEHFTFFLLGIAIAVAGLGAALYGSKRRKA